jgi:hypothetical protein
MFQTLMGIFRDFRPTILAGLITSITFQEVPDHVVHSNH